MSDLQNYKCPNCGSSVQWDATSQKVKCPYCESEFEMDVIKQQAGKEEEYADNIGTAKWEVEEEKIFSEEESDNLLHYVCDNCGGEIITDKDTAATKCPYCDSNVVLKKNVSGMHRPDLVIPFSLEKEEAQRKYEEHLKGKPLLPKDFCGQNEINEIKGVYIPFFLFDGVVEGKMRFEGIRTHVHRHGDEEITEHEHFAVYRSGTESFKNVPVDASSKVNNAMMQSIEPFDYSKMVDFESAYLSGYLADKYSVSMEDCKPEANMRIANSLEASLRSTIYGFNTINTVSRHIRLDNPHIQYALLPVWILHTTYKNKNYIFAMNGQTGKFVGDLPVDKGRLIVYLLLTLFGSFIVLTALAVLLGIR